MKEAKDKTKRGTKLIAKFLAHGFLASGFLVTAMEYVPLPVAVVVMLLAVHVAVE